ncbi:hypothetical protein G7Y89_g13965 [Cudoniella acicularis]|uniref:Uncharacterized protein n=1 Tax=Cudoniella acicularis TaxID=354080 RepID=A0A8H4VVH9_9HELO|nr:hypothetical protein G7Y89_g13965 [Cudoniella acicularis]
MSKTLHTKPAPKALDSTSADTASESEPQTYEFNVVQNPLQNALNMKYPPERMEALAHTIVSKSFPFDAADGAPKRANPFLLARKSNTYPSIKTPAEEHGRAYEAAHDTGNFVSSIMVTVAKTPVAFFYNLANGFHNAPSFLLNDHTVRRRDNITGFGSGVKVAGKKEFTLGLYDGFTGLVTHPYNGARRHGLGGFLTGIGQGAGGLIFKTSAAAIGLPGYTLKGVEKQFQKRHDRSLKAKLLAIRMRQSLLEFEGTTKEEKEEIIKRWRELDVVLPS